MASPHALVSELAGESLRPALAREVDDDGIGRQLRDRNLPLGRPVVGALDGPRLALCEQVAQMSLVLRVRVRARDVLAAHPVGDAGLLVLPLEEAKPPNLAVMFLTRGDSAEKGHGDQQPHRCHRSARDGW